MTNQLAFALVKEMVVTYAVLLNLDPAQQPLVLPIFAWLCLLLSSLIKGDWAVYG